MAQPGEEPRLLLHSGRNIATQGYLDSHITLFLARQVQSMVTCGIVRGKCKGLWSHQHHQSLVFSLGQKGTSKPLVTIGLVEFVINFGQELDLFFAGQQLHNKFCGLFIAEDGVGRAEAAAEDAKLLVEEGPGTKE